MKRILFASALALAGFSASAQMPYDVSTTTAPYQPLVNGTSLNGTRIWKDSTFSVPLGFDFKLGTQTISRFNLLSNNFISTDTIGTISGILITDAELIDRGADDTVSKSPIRYEVTGTPGNRIFKVEWSNAGFAAELDVDNTLNDSLNMQIWMYEGSNIIELRYGPSRITHFSDYFTMLGLPLIGYVKNLNFMTASLEKIYLLSGNPTSPGIDSFSITNPVAAPLNAFPQACTVYRFTPKSTTGVGGGLELEGLKVYPTVSRDQLHVRFSDTRPVSYHIMAINGSITPLSGTLKTGDNQIDIRGLAAGQYLLRLKTQDRQQIIRLIKE